MKDTCDLRVEIPILSVYTFWINKRSKSENIKVIVRPFVCFRRTASKRLRTEKSMIHILSVTIKGALFITMTAYTLWVVTSRLKLLLLCFTKVLVGWNFRKLKRFWCRFILFCFDKRASLKNTSAISNNTYLSSKVLNRLVYSRYLFINIQPCT